MTRNSSVKFPALLFSLALLFSFYACNDSDSDMMEQTENILPERFGLDVPSALTISNSGGRVSSLYADYAQNADDINGEGVYELLRYFIFLGDASSKIVQGIIFHVAGLQIYGVTSATFTGEDDDREKNLEVYEGGTYDGVSYEYSLIVTDAESEGNDDGGTALRVFWNRSPIKGVAVLVPYNLDRRENPEDHGTVFRIDYDETGGSAYDATMTVSISGLPLEDPEEDPFSVNNLKMFVGRSGDILDVYGNSNHPNTNVFSEESDGINWAFVASGIDEEGIGVAEVGLPPSSLDASGRADILDEFAIQSVLRSVFVNALNQEFPEAPEDLFTELLDSLLADAQAPGFFGADGFIQGGESPGDAWDPLSDRIEALAPYNPSDISNLIIELN